MTSPQSYKIIINYKIAGPGDNVYAWQQAMLSLTLIQITLLII